MLLLLSYSTPQSPFAPAAYSLPPQEAALETDSLALLDRTRRFLEECDAPQGEHGRRGQRAGVASVGR